MYIGASFAYNAPRRRIGDEQFDIEPRIVFPSGGGVRRRLLPLTCLDECAGAWKRKRKRKRKLERACQRRGRRGEARDRLDGRASLDVQPTYSVRAFNKPSSSTH